MTRYRLVACSDGPLSEGDIKIAVAACAFLYSAAKHGIYSPSAFDEDRGRAAEALQTGLEAALKGAGDDKDGERYRWLRSHWDEPEVEKLRPWDDFSPDPDQLDAQVDAGISSAKGEV